MSDDRCTIDDLWAAVHFLGGNTFDDTDAPKIGRASDFLLAEIQRRERRKAKRRLTQNGAPQ